MPRGGAKNKLKKKQKKQQKNKKQSKKQSSSQPKKVEEEKYESPILSKKGLLDKYDIRLGPKGYIPAPPGTPKSVRIHEFSMVDPGGGRELLTKTEIQIRENSIYGLVGKNGFGKTTLLKLMYNYEIEGYPPHVRMVLVNQEELLCNEGILRAVLQADEITEQLIKEEDRLTLMTEQLDDNTQQDEINQIFEMIWGMHEDLNYDQSEKKAMQILTGLPHHFLQIVQQHYSLQQNHLQLLFLQHIHQLHPFLGGGCSFSAGGQGKGMYTRLYREVLGTYHWINHISCSHSIFDDSGIFTLSPSISPTISPTTPSPTSNTLSPTQIPTTDPTSDPTPDPTDDPTTNPTRNPTQSPTPDPTTDPTTDPTPDPTKSPTINPTKNPSSDPTFEPTIEPTNDPTNDPTLEPTTNPTDSPTIDPTTDPTDSPTGEPTFEPTQSPTESDNEALAIGLGVSGGGIALIIIVVLLFCYCRKKELNNEQMSGIPNEDSEAVSKDYTHIPDDEEETTSQIVMA